MRPVIFGTVRARLMALLALAAVPLIALAALLAWQSYSVAGDQARQLVLLAREAAAARHEAALTSAQHLVAALAASPRLWMDPPRTCSTFLAQVATLSPDRYARIVAVLPDGDVRCDSEPATVSSEAYGTEPWFAELRTTRKPLDGRLQPERGEDDNLIVAASVGGLEAADQPFEGALAIILRLDWFLHASEILPLDDKDRTEGWLVKPDGAPLPIGTARRQDLPPPAVLASLASDPSRARLARSEGGSLFAYASTTLPDMLRLVVGFRAQDVIGPARHVLILRIIALGAVMLAGIGIVAIGANQAVAEPVKRLTGAVRRWRADAARGGAFDPVPRRGLPAEIIELSQAFADTTKALVEREAELRTAVANQNLLMREIHHRVKNNLQIVASLLNLQANRITAPAAKAEFQSARDRVRALATLHRHLYSEGDLHTINMRGFLTELCGQLFQAMGESEGGRIHLDIEAPELTMSSDQATPLSLIVTEAVSNSLKYAFPGGRRGNISVCLTADQETATLVIQDDGVGIPAGRGETETGTRDGLGLQLMSGFARQLGTELIVEKAPDGHPGTRYSLTLRLRQRAEAPVPV